MKGHEYFNHLQTNTPYLVSVMVENNLDGLNDRASQLQLSNRELSKDEMFDLFKKESKLGNLDNINGLINGVDYVPNKLTKGNDRFFLRRV